MICSRSWHQRTHQRRVLLETPWLPHNFSACSVWTPKIQVCGFLISHVLLHHKQLNSLKACIKRKNRLFTYLDNSESLNSFDKDSYSPTLFILLNQGKCLGGCCVRLAISSPLRIEQTRLSTMRWVTLRLKEKKEKKSICDHKVYF